MMTRSLRASATMAFFSPFLLLDSPVPCGKIGITLSSNYPGNLTKHTFYIRIAFGDRGAIACSNAVSISAICDLRES